MNGRSATTIIFQEVSLLLAAAISPLIQCPFQTGNVSGYSKLWCLSRMTVTECTDLSAFVTWNRLNIWKITIFDNYLCYRQERIKGRSVELLRDFRLSI